MTQKASSRIIVALDVPTSKEAFSVVHRLGQDVVYKVGLQLYSGSGPTVVREILAYGADVFVDLKLHDIPNTVANAVKTVEGLGANMLTVHLSGGSEMIRAAVGARARGKDLWILGVTVLTSANEQTLNEIGTADPIDKQVLRLARLGVENGVDGIVASAHEIKMLRTEFGNKIKIVVPGIRPSWAEPGDQKRTMTPGQAIEAGADYLVIGRPITAAKSPREALERILEEIGR